jgi:hypothetical protein
MTKIAHNGTYEFTVNRTHCRKAESNGRFLWFVQLQMLRIPDLRGRSIVVTIVLIAIAVMFITKCGGQTGRQGIELLGR